MSEVSIALNRFGLGGRRTEAAPADPRGWLVGQIARFDPRPAALSDRPSSAAATRELVTTIQDIRQALQTPAAQRSAEMASMNATDGLPEPVVRRFRAGRDIYYGDVGRRGRLALTSATPFVERMVHFWANHFTVSVAKPVIAPVAGPFEFDAIRPHVTGTFAQILKAAALHPAMLCYLDQFQSIGPNSRATQLLGRRGAANGQPRGLNDNLAREILELHTLGVGGHPA